MIKSRFSISVHILSVLAKYSNEWISSDLIAGSLNTNPVVVRNEIGNLKRHGLVESKEGKGGGVRLAKPADMITFAHILKAVKEEHIFGFAKNEPNPACPIGKQINERLHEFYCSIEDEMDGLLKNKKLSTFIETFREETEMV